MTVITVTIDRIELRATIDRNAPLGWRFWTLPGFPNDPIDPRPYGGSRCLPLAIVEIDGNSRWLCAMELDRSFRLFCSHDLFPCPLQDHADSFAHEIIERHARQPGLL